MSGNGKADIVRVYLLVVADIFDRKAKIRRVTALFQDALCGFSESEITKDITSDEESKLTQIIERALNEEIKERKWLENIIGREEHG